MNENWVDWDLLSVVHKQVRRVAQSGDMVVDATLGNGHDTLFLAQCVGATGCVVGFDIQASAIESTRQRLRQADILDDRCHFYEESHTHLMERVKNISSDVRGKEEGEVEKVSAILFNLGYLPGADKSLITQVESTIDALNQSIKCLKPQGVLSVMCYPGHPGGEKEAQAVSEWMLRVDGRSGDVSSYRRRRGSEKSPFLWVYSKI